MSGLYKSRQIIWIFLGFISYVKWQWCLSSASNIVKVSCNQRSYCADTLTYDQGSPGPWAHARSSSRQLLGITFLTLSGDHLLGLRMNFLWLPITRGVKSMLLIWIDQFLHKLVLIYVTSYSLLVNNARPYLLTPTMGQALLSVLKAQREKRWACSQWGNYRQDRWHCSHS